MEYNFSEIEQKWKKIWAENGVYKVTEDPTRPKYYVLDMFPYPSGAGLHVGHPLGYVASDIYARYKRLKGYNVLHPMGYDAFGLPAEQYAIETGTHPQVTTEKAIARYREQLDKIGFSFDWSRQVTTCDPAYYKWTQWIFLKLFGSWYNREADKAEPIETLINRFETQGAQGNLLREGVDAFTAQQWGAFSRLEKEKILMHYRLAFLSYAEVNWCEALGTVLANDEVKDGKSERGGHPVERRKMRQWFLRITEYSDRLLNGLNTVDWSEAMKEMQRNWIGRSEGASVKFNLSLTLSEGEGTGRPRYHTTDPLTWNTSIQFAKEHRANPTEAEAILWEMLRAKKTGFRFRRQHPIDRYIADFVCMAKGLVVEVDGAVHLKQQQEDAERTEVMKKYGFDVLRFTNEEVIANTTEVVKKIVETLNQRQERKVPSFGGDLGEVSTKGDHTRTNASSTNEGTSPLGGGKEGDFFAEDFIEVFTTRPDTIFGATFMVIAPEHPLVGSITTPEQKQEVEQYIAYVKSRTDVERQQEKKVTGAFTGAYAINPFTQQPIPVWIAEYVLAGYGTGAIMAVPADDERDRKFAEKFGLPIVEVIDKSMYPGAGIEDKVGKMINSGFLNGLEVKDAIQEILDEIEDLKIGTRKVNYKQRDAGYSRQRYWGEPFPIKYKVQGQPDGVFADEGEHDDIPVPISENDLPLTLPQVSSFKPTGDGRSPLANNEDWVKAGYETDTMPGYAGSSWYFLRYMDANNPDEFAAKDKLNYWQNVDVYFGGAEHAVGHLLYARMWHKFLYDLGYVPTDEPFKKLVNQGMIQGRSSFVYRVNYTAYITIEGGVEKPLVPQVWISREYYEKHKAGLLTVSEREKIEAACNLAKLHARTLGYRPENLNYYVDSFTPLHVEIDLVNNDKLDVAKFETSSLRSEYGKGKSFFVLNEEGEYICGVEVEKMSKSKYNVVNPDDVIEKHGADCFRMFEMFLGPIEQSKPWDDKGISGVSNFLKKFWRLFYTDKGEWRVVEAGDEPSPAEYKVLHKTLKKLEDDIERLNFNTCISGFMIATNELQALGCHKRAILEPLLIAIAPFAPFVAEELWQKLGNTGSVHHAQFPKVEQQYLVESSHKYPVSINGKVRAEIELPLDIDPADAEKQVLALENVSKWTNGNPPKKFVYVKGRIINVVV